MTAARAKTTYPNLGRLYGLSPNGRQCHRLDDPEEAVQQLRLVEIDFPFRRAAFDEEKTALLVDGQQRTAALAQVSIDSRPQVDLSVNAVITGIDAAKVVFGVAINTLLTRKCGQNVATDGSSGRALHAV